MAGTASAILEWVPWRSLGIRIALGAAAVGTLWIGGAALTPAVALAWVPNDGGRADHPLRVALLTAVRAEPGLHLAALADQVGKSTELVSYHLSILEACGAVTSGREGKYRAYFPSGHRPDGSPASILLRDRTRRAIMDRLANGDGLTQRDLARELGITQSAVSYHLRTLQNHGLLDAGAGWPARYRVRGAVDEPRSP